MEKVLRNLSSKSEAAGAIRYALSRWRTLTRYTDDGMLEIDSSAAERALRRSSASQPTALYDGMPTYEMVAGHGEDVRVIIPPYVTAVRSAKAEHNQSQQDQHILSIAARERLGWQEETKYGQRALVETAMGRYKTINCPCLRVRSFPGLKAEAAVGVAVLTRMLDAGRPDSVRRLNIAA